MECTLISASSKSTPHKSTMLQEFLLYLRHKVDLSVAVQHQKDCFLTEKPDSDKSECLKKKSLDALCRRHQAVDILKSGESAAGKKPPRQNCQPVTSQLFPLSSK